MPTREVERLEQELIEQTHQRLREKISCGEFNGDVQENILLVLISINRRIGRVARNPMVIFGELFQRFPALVVPTAVVAWVMLGATAVLAILGLIEAVGADLIIAVP